MTAPVSGGVLSPRNPKMNARRRVSSFNSWISDYSAGQAQKRLQEDEVQERSRKKTQEVCDDSSSPVLAKQGRRVQKNIVRDISEIRRLCNAADQNCSGSIGQCDFFPLLQKLMRLPKSEMDMTEVLHQWDDLDSDAAGQISVEVVQRWYCNAFGIDDSLDFTAFFSQELVPQWQQEVRDIARKLQLEAYYVEKIWNEFKKLDKDGDGSLSKKEFGELIRKYFEKALPKKRGKDSHTIREDIEVPPKMLQKFWNDVDADGNGTVSFEEFTSWYHKTFDGDSCSPMEQYYQQLGTGYRSNGGTR